jgi:hypothetical protein
MAWLLDNHSCFFGNEVFGRHSLAYEKRVIDGKMFRHGFCFRLRLLHRTKEWQINMRKQSDDSIKDQFILQ